VLDYQHGRRIIIKSSLTTPGNLITNTVLILLVGSQPATAAMGFHTIPLGV
jgi:hypothetical protein